jgi:hypothetical protein
MARVINNFRAKANEALPNVFGVSSHQALEGMETLVYNVGSRILVFDLEKQGLPQRIQNQGVGTRP